MFALLQSLLAVAAIATASYGLGSAVLRGLGLSSRDRTSDLVFSLTIGLIVAGTALAALGMVGLLHVPLIGVATLGGVFWTIGVVMQPKGAAGSESPDDLATLDDSGESSGKGPSGMAPPRWLLRFALVAAGVAALGSLVGAAAPTTAGDALCYHLELPKAFLADHRLAFYPYSENSTFPLLVEMWFLWAMALDGPVAAGMVHWLAGVLFAGATVVLATPIVGRRWAWLAGCFALLVPGVTNQMTEPMNDLGLALTTTVALAAWWRGVVLEEGRRWLVVAGIAAGGALASKYLALLFAVAMAAGCVWVARRRGHKRRLVLESIAVVSIVAVSTAGMWYVRAAWHRGNPVYPFLSEVFLAEGPLHGEAHETLPESKSRLGRTAWGPITAAWHVTMHPDGLGGRSHQPGVLFLALLPGLLLVRRLRGLGTLAVIGVTYWLVWYLLRQNVRFLFPLIPIAAVAAVWVVAEMQRFPTSARWAGTALVCAILAAYTGLAAMRCHDRLAVATGIQSRDAYLLTVEPTWQAAQWCNGIRHPDDHLLSLDYRAFYFDCPVTRESVFRRYTGYDRSIDEPEALVPLLCEAGFTHLLLAENLSDHGVQFDPTLPALVADCRAAGGVFTLPVLWEYTVDDMDGGERRYELVLVR